MINCFFFAYTIVRFVWRSMELFLVVLITIFLAFFPLSTFGFFFRKSESNDGTKSSKECCVLPKINVDWRKANLGRDFFRQLTVNSDASGETTTPDNMCNLIHFLFQQASMNKKPVTISEGFTDCVIYMLRS